MPHPRTMIATVLTAVVVAGLAVGAYGLGSASPQTAQAATAAESGDPHGIHVGGVGKVTGVPDVLRFTVGVEVTQPAVQDALGGASTAAATVIDALKQAGVASEDLQTASVDLQPQYDDKGRTIAGYVARQNLTVKLRDLDTAGATITKAVQAGGDAARLSGVEFALEDNQALLTKARDAAYADARDKAEQYAKLADRPLGDVVSVQENVAPGPQPYPQSFAADSSSDARSAVPIEAGSQQVEVTVDVTWSLR